MRHVPLVLVSVAAFVPSDPLAAQEWHLDALGVRGAWSLGFIGRGVAVGIYDDGIERWHPDLASQIDTSRQVWVGGRQLAGDPLAGAEHGTAVAGIVAAAANGSAGVGVAPGARLTGVDIFRLDNWTLFEAMNGQRGFDVVNHSWGWIGAFADPVRDPWWGRFFQGLEDAVDNGRGGLGTIMVTAAGNGRQDGASTNLSGFTATRATIDVAAIGPDGAVAFYSSPGASILVGAPSSSWTGGILTTDRTGWAGYDAGDTTWIFGGTSAAAPMVTGVVALMLEANPGLGWRDVQSILAASARPVGSATINAGVGVNGQGLAHSNDTGFGLVDASAAVRMAMARTEAETSANERVASGTAWGARDIPDGNGNGTSFDIWLPNTVRVENLELIFEQGFHVRASDLVVDVRSPSGVWSRLLDRNGGDEAMPAGVLLGSNAFRGETSGGTWTVVVRDMAPGATGWIDGVGLSVYGADASDARMAYTDRFATSGDATIRDRGLDTVDFSAVTGGVTLNLAQGWGVVAGRNLAVEPGARIERVVGTLADDFVVGSASQNQFVVAGKHTDSTLHWGAAATHGGEVIRLYDVTLGRLPDMDGFQWWTGRLDAGASTREVLSFTLTSPEFTSRYGANTSNEAFVDIVYRNALGRPAEAEGRDYWIGRLNEGLAREDVILAFADSREKRLAMDEVAIVTGPSGRDRLAEIERVQFRDGTIALDLDDGVGTAWRLYRAGLDRDPDPQGLQFYANRIAAGTSATQIASEMLNSPESAARLGPAPTNAAFVDAIYRDVLDRGSDEAGKAYWTGRLDAGLSRADLVVAFADSAEFKLAVVDRAAEGLWTGNAFPFG